jgi:glycosyltransferase involved in cell wall biosynthesis
MLWSKGLSDFIEVAKKLKARDLNVRFVLVGKPELNDLYGANLKTLIKLDKSGIVEWWGFKENMDKVIQQSHIFCLPTKYGEGVPKVLIEAAACGKPLVGSNTSGCREIIFDGLNGFLSEPGNIDSLSSSLERLILSRKLRLNMGLKSRIIAESEFSISEVTNKTITQYKKLLKLLP